MDKMIMVVLRRLPDWKIKWFALQKQAGSEESHRAVEMATKICENRGGSAQQGYEDHRVAELEMEVCTLAVLTKVDGIAWKAV